MLHCKNSQLKVKYNKQTERPSLLRFQSPENGLILKHCAADNPPHEVSACNLLCEVMALIREASVMQKAPSDCCSDSKMAPCAGRDGGSLDFMVVRSVRVIGRRLFVKHLVNFQ